MGLEHVRKTYEDFGEEDPFFAVLSNKSRKGGKWDPEEFFQTGRDEIAEAMAVLARLGCAPARGQALDFGCGVGRLTQALGDNFERSVGVDISSSMLATAREHNRHGEGVRYVQNTVPDLSQFESASFDFIYSNIALQHTPRETAEAYISDFFRLLTDGGVALFQVPDGPPYALGSLRQRLMAFWRGPVRRVSKKLRGKATVEIHYVPRPVVESLASAAGCTVLEAFDLAEGRKRWGSFRYCIRKSRDQDPKLA